MAIMRERIGLDNLESEVLKAPHHGSHEFDFKALKAMKPVVSIISSGDETARTEHIHPRATLVSALGKVSRGETGIVLCTELVAFFKMRDYSHTRAEIADMYKKAGNDPLARVCSPRVLQGLRRTRETENTSDYLVRAHELGIIHTAPMASACWFLPQCQKGSRGLPSPSM